MHRTDSAIVAREPSARYEGVTSTRATACVAWASHASSSLRLHSTQSTYTQAVVTPPFLVGERDTFSSLGHMTEAHIPWLHSQEREPPSPSGPPVAQGSLGAPPFTTQRLLAEAFTAIKQGRGVRTSTTHTLLSTRPGMGRVVDVPMSSIVTFIHAPLFSFANSAGPPLVQGRGQHARLAPRVGSAWASHLANWWPPLDAGAPRDIDR